MEIFIFHCKFLLGYCPVPDKIIIVYSLPMTDKKRFEMSNGKWL